MALCKAVFLRGANTKLSKPVFNSGLKCKKVLNVKFRTGDNLIGGLKDPVQNNYQYQSYIFLESFF